MGVGGARGKKPAYGTLPIVLTEAGENHVLFQGLAQCVAVPLADSGVAAPSPKAPKAKDAFRFSFHFGNNDEVTVPAPGAVVLATALDSPAVALYYDPAVAVMGAAGPSKATVMAAAAATPPPAAAAPSVPSARRRPPASGSDKGEGGGGGGGDTAALGGPRWDGPPLRPGAWISTQFHPEASVRLFQHLADARVIDLSRVNTAADGNGNDQPSYAPIGDVHGRGLLQAFLKMLLA